MVWFEDVEYRRQCFVSSCVIFSGVQVDNQCRWQLDPFVAGAGLRVVALVAFTVAVVIRHSARVATERICVAVGLARLVDDVLQGWWLFVFLFLFDVDVEVPVSEDLCFLWTGACAWVGGRVLHEARRFLNDCHLCMSYLFLAFLYQCIQGMCAAGAIVCVRADC